MSPMNTESAQLLSLIFLLKILFAEMLEVEYKIFRTKRKLSDRRKTVQTAQVTKETL